jgi:hypothetical protein
MHRSQLSPRFHRPRPLCAHASRHRSASQQQNIHSESLVTLSQSFFPITPPYCMPGNLS